MTLQRLTFQPGIVKDETDLAARPRWTDGTNVRFRRGRPEPRGGNEEASITTATGIPRNMFAWADNSSNLFGVTGTHRQLWAYVGGRQHNITPIASSGTLGTNPITLGSASTTATIADSAHGMVDGALAYLYGASAVGGVQIGGVQTTLGTNPFVSGNGSDIITVTHTTHGFAHGEIARFPGTSTIAGVTINGQYTVSVLDEDEYEIQAATTATADSTAGGTPAVDHFKGYEISYVDADTYTVVATSTSTAAGTGGGTAVEYQYELNPGNEHGEGGGGYGVGGYGLGGYGVGGSDEAETFPRTWSFDQWGEDLVALPRRGKIYQWSLNWSQRGTVASTNAPSNSEFMFVTPERIMFAGGAHDGSNPKLMDGAWSDQEDLTIWTSASTNLAGRFPLAGGSVLLAGSKSTNQNLILSNTALFSMRYTANAQTVYQFDIIGNNCGVIGPNAVAEKDGMAFWVSNSQQFYLYDGSVPRIIDCPNRDFFFDNLVAGQEEKVVVAANTQFTEFWILYPSTAETLECDAYMTWNWQTGEWSLGNLARTAMMDRSVLGNPMSADANGVVYFMESGTSDAGTAIAALITSSPFEIGDGDVLMDIFRYIPDFKDLSVGVKVTLIAKDFSASSEEETVEMTITPTTTDVDLNPRISGRQAQIQIESLSDPDTFWRGGDFRLDIEPAGEV